MLSTPPSLRAALAAAASLLALAVAPAVASADATVNINAGADVFAPPDVAIQAGQKVTWNFNGGFHNLFVLADGAPFPADPPALDAADVKAPAAGPFSRTFGAAGSFRFFCSIHFQGMRGTVTVQPGTTPPPPPPPPTELAPLPPEPVAFASDRSSPGAADIFSLKAALDPIARLTSNLSSDDSSPAFSHDGGRIAFQSNRDAQAPSDADIFVMNADGSDEANLTQSLARNASPAWSPDDRRIAFSSDRTGNGDLYVMDADGTGLRQLTTEFSEDLEPTWSRDGTKLAFTSDRSGKKNVWTIDVPASGPGTNATQVAEGTAGLEGPAFSPTADRLAYAKFRGGGPDRDICVVDLGVPGSESCRTTNTAQDVDPAWSPDGRQVLFTREEGTDRDLFLLDIDPPAPERPVTDSARFEEPAWSPVVNAPLPAGTQPAPAPAPAPAPEGEPEDTRPDPGTAGAPGAFLGLDQPHRTRLKGLRRLGMVVTGRCTGVGAGTVRLTVSGRLARRLGLKRTTLASAPVRCGGDKKATALLKPGAKVRKALATPKARRVVKRADGLNTTVTMALTGGGRTLRAALPVLIRS